MSHRLAILIPTLDVPDRKNFLARLMKCLGHQLKANPEVGVYTLVDKGAETTGRKRQRLIESVDAEFVAFVDDDDLVAPSYCTEIMQAIRQGADVVGFHVQCYEDGMLTGYAHHSLDAEKWGETRRQDGLVHFTRTPNHLNPIRRTMALEIGYPSMVEGEDADYARRLYAKFGKTMKEIFIDKFLYRYFLRTRKTAFEPMVQMYGEDGAMTREGIEETIRRGGSVMVKGQICTTLAQLETCGR